MEPSSVLLARLAWFAPWWGLALPAAVGLPLLAHWLRRRGGALIWFPATRFVQQAVSESAQFHRPRQFALLTLRVAALVAVVLAFMQPTWVGRAASASSSTAGWDVMLVLDRSASMRRVEGGATLFAQARRQAGAMISELDPTRDRAGVILADQHPTTLLAEPTANFDVLRTRLREAKVTYEQANLDRALNRARVQVGRGNDRSGISNAADTSTKRRKRRIEMFSDRQGTSWPASRIKALRKAGVPVRVHNLGHGKPNLAIFSAKVSHKRPVVGVPTRLSATVANFSNQQRTVSVTARVHQPPRPDPMNSGELAGKAEPAGQTTVRIGAFSRTTIQLPIRFDQSGWRAVDLAIEPGGGPNESMSNWAGLKGDDRTGAIVEVLDSRPVTLVTRADADDSSRAAYYVVRALAPDPGEDRAKINVKVISPQALVPRAGRMTSTRGRARGEVLVLVEAGSLETNELRGLGRWLTSTSGAGVDGGDMDGGGTHGGGVLWFIDSQAAVNSMQRFDQMAQAPRLALKPLGKTPWDQSLGLGLELPPATAVGVRGFLRPFAGTSRSALADQRFNAAMHAQLTDGATALLNFDNDQPAAAIGSVGLAGGRVGLFAAAIDPQRSTLVNGPMFVTLIHQFIDLLSTSNPPGEGLAGSNPHPSQPLGLPRIRTGTLVGPGLQTRSDRIAEAPGAYWLFDARGEPAGGTWVNLVPAESDLRVASRDDNQKAGAAADSPANRGGPDQGQSVPLDPRRTEIWPYLALAALLLLGIESLCLLWWPGMKLRHCREAGSKRDVSALP